MSGARARPTAAYGWVAAGAATGALARWLVAGWLDSGAGPSGGAFPWATLAVNVGGSLLIGMLAGLVARRLLASVSLQLALMTGFCGAFTTFSAFGLETVFLVRAGHPGLAMAYVLVSLPLWLAAAWAGYRLAAQGRWGAAR